MAFSSHCVQKNLLTNFDAPKNQLAHENHFIKRPSHLPTVLLYQLDFIPLENALHYDLPGAKIILGFLALKLHYD